jgi:hypothetical protein
MKHKTVSRYAFAEITADIKENAVMSDTAWEIWNVRPSHMNTKETRRLNRQLGLGGINKIGNTNGFK